MTLPLYDELIGTCGACNLIVQYYSRQGDLNFLHLVGKSRINFLYPLFDGAIGEKDKYDLGLTTANGDGIWMLRKWA